MNAKSRVCSLFALLFVTALACNAPSPTALQTMESPATQLPAATEVLATLNVLEATEVAVNVVHLQIPSSDNRGATLYDTESSGTGPEKRAPYGDSYDINLLERPFLQDMTYIPDLDIHLFGINQDDNWYYVSIKLIGEDPNNNIGIYYAVELDTNKDGFGDFIIRAQPPYTDQWMTVNVQVFADTNHDTSGLSADQSDAPVTGDGYDSLIFDGSQGSGDDPDLAWIRTTNSKTSTLEFAFKRSWAGNIFLYGVVADAGLKDVAQLDYVDRFKESEAGSPVRDKKYYPLQALYSVDNTCRQAVGFAPNGYEPMICPVSVPSGPDGGNDGDTTISGCQPPAGGCSANAPNWWPDPHCACSTTPYHP